MSKGRYMARVCYDDEFKPEIEKFLQLIYLDRELDKLARNKNQRFSAVIRWLIEKYNTQRGPKVIEESKKSET